MDQKEIVNTALTQVLQMINARLGDVIPLIKEDINKIANAMVIELEKKEDVKED